MRWLVCVTCWAGFLAYPTLAAAGPYGCLYQPAYAADREARYPAEPYTPQPGDLILASNPNLLWTTMYRFARTGKPGHAAVVFALPDGTVALLEAGSQGKLVVGVVPLRRWLFVYKGTAWVRRRRCPLTAEQSARLTQFALLNDRKRYAVLRLLAQLTPFKTRGYFRTAYVGRPHGIRRSYICSEIVLEALVYAGLLDAETTRPSATYPRDLFYDCSLIPFVNDHLHLDEDWEIPARWTPCPCPCRPALPAPLEAPP